MKLPSLILASESPRRRELLRQLDVEFAVLSSDTVEVSHDNLTAGEISQINAYRKARQVAKQHPDALVIGADTLVSLGDRIFGKPHHREEAAAMLRSLSGTSHRVVTGVCLLELRRHHQRVFYETSFVTFHPLSDRSIQAYLESINPLDKAGGYAIQANGEMIVESIIGSFTNVVGLPLGRLREELMMW